MEQQTQDRDQQTLVQKDRLSSIQQRLEEWLSEHFYHRKIIASKISQSMWIVIKILTI